MANVFLVTLELDAGYFREAQASGQTKAELRKELKLALKDELNEYNFDRVLKDMLTGPVFSSGRSLLVEKGV